MEPAFIIRHFAGKVKYQIKVGDGSDGHKKKKIFLAFMTVLSEHRNFAGNRLNQMFDQVYFRYFPLLRLEDNAHYGEKYLE